MRARPPTQRVQGVRRGVNMRAWPPRQHVQGVRRVVNGTLRVRGVPTLVRVRRVVHTVPTLVCKILSKCSAATHVRSSQSQCKKCAHSLRQLWVQEVRAIERASESMAADVQAARSSCKECLRSLDVNMRGRQPAALVNAFKECEVAKPIYTALTYCTNGWYMRR